MGGDMAGKMCIVTGSSSGIGVATAEGLAKAGATVIMACRNTAKAEPVAETIRKSAGSDKVRVMHLELGSQKSIRAFAETFRREYDRLDVLVNNAAIVPRQRETTEDGLEAQFGVNHLGPFLLTHLLLDLLKASAPSRIVNVSSELHHRGRIDFDDLQSEKKYNNFTAYQQSKLANVLFTYELARRLEGTGVTVNTLHPGVIYTGLMRELPAIIKPLWRVVGLFLITPEKGAATTLYLATSPEVEGVTGKYFEKCAEAKSSPESHDAEAARRLWDVSAEMAGLA